MDWQELLKVLREYVPADKVTTYGNLSEKIYGHRGGAQAIVAMLQGAVAANYENRILTNRVVRSNGQIPNVNGQLQQLQGEGIPMQNGRIDFHKCPPVHFDRVQPPAHNDMPRIADDRVAHNDMLRIVDDRVREHMLINEPRRHNRIILIIGDSQIGRQDIIDVARDFGVDENDLEFQLQYYRNTFNVNNLRNNARYRCVFVGPNAHSMAGLDGYNNLIARLKEDEGFPPYFELRTASGELRISRESLRIAFTNLCQRNR
jgi:alkylated DNA nucleotide flippase Atl1